MGVLLESARLLAENAAEAFGKADGEPSKCPRCKGSGLHMEPSTKNSHSTSTNSNNPCWFCEGMGVMAVASTDGYMLGRSNSLLNTGRFEKHLGMPVSFHLYSGKFPEAKTKLVSYKPSKHILQELQEPLSTPALHRDLPRNAASSSSSFSETQTSDSAEFNEFSSWTFMSLKHLGEQHRHNFHARLSAPFANSKAAAVTRPSLSVKPTAAVPGDSSALMLQISSKTQRRGSDPKTKNFQILSKDALDSESLQKNDFPSRRASRRLRENAWDTSLRKPTLPPHSDLDSGAGSILREGKGGEDAKCTTRWSRHSRLQRKPRNRVREEVEKEIVVRTLRAQHSLATRKLLTPPASSDPLLDTLLNDQNADLIEQQGKKTNARIRWPLVSSSTADLSLINKLVYKKAKDVMTCKSSSTTKI
uniref:Uncharacterized protein n=1 Tax=Physcomitrium patens TaxID=3218 RepID=A9ST62_PHYPA|nr:hypothetical protein PHYPA_006857 [Physcomitrium patens]